MQMTFFGTQSDIAQAWRWLLETPGVRVCEEYSRLDQESRWFSTWEELAESIGAPDQGLAAWSEDFGGQPEIKSISFDEAARRQLGATGRTVLQSPAFIRIRQNNDQQGCLAHSTFGCWSEAGARQRSIYSEHVLNSVDWKNLNKTTAAIARRINKESPAKLRSYSIMPDAWRRFEAREIRLWNFGSECAYPSDLISR
jgi:hypothetical protein